MMVQAEMRPSALVRFHIWYPFLWQMKCVEMGKKDTSLYSWKISHYNWAGWVLTPSRHCAKIYTAELLTPDCERYWTTVVTPKQLWGLSRGACLSLWWLYLWHPPVCLPSETQNENVGNYNVNLDAGSLSIQYAYEEIGQWITFGFKFN